MELKIHYEDNHIIVCSKKPGILSQAGSLDLPDMLTMIKAYIKERYQKPGNVYLGLVHRLDLNVGGVMVFAKTSKAAKRLSEQIRHHQFNKKYVGVVNGKLEPMHKSTILEDYILKDNHEKKAVITDQSKGQYAKLIYHPLEHIVLKNSAYTLLDIELITGRFHQIRAQLAHQGYPLYGDNKYGEKTKGYELALYAYHLSFTHPTTKQALSFMDYPSNGIFNQFPMFGGKLHAGTK